MHQHFPLKDPPKFTQIGILGLKTNHLASLGPSKNSFKMFICVDRKTSRPWSNWLTRKNFCLSANVKRNRLDSDYFGHNQVNFQTIECTSQPLPLKWNWFLAKTQQKYHISFVSICATSCNGIKLCTYASFYKFQASLKYLFFLNSWFYLPVGIIN
jgi:hypothetical protein